MQALHLEQWKDLGGLIIQHVLQNVKLISYPLTIVSKIKFL